MNRLWIAVCVFACCVAYSSQVTSPWIQIEGCYNITSSARSFSMTSQARPSECFGLCNSASVALQGKMCYCDPSYSDNSQTFQNFLRDGYCPDVCPGSPKVFCGGGQSAMSVYTKGTSVLSELGINPSDHGCVYVQMNGTPSITGYVDQFCNQNHGVVCYEHCSYSCFKSAASLTWAEALRYCSNCSANIVSILAPGDRVRSCKDLSSTPQCNIKTDKCSPQSAGTFSYWIGLYKDKATDESSTNVPSTQSSRSPITSRRTTTNVVDVTDDSNTNVSSTPSSGPKTNVGAIIGGSVGGIALVGGTAVVICLYRKFCTSVSVFPPASDLNAPRRRVTTMSEMICRLYRLITN